MLRLCRPSVRAARSVWPVRRAASAAVQSPRAARLTSFHSRIWTAHLALPPFFPFFPSSLHATQRTLRAPLLLLPWLREIVKTEKKRMGVGSVGVVGAAIVLLVEVVAVAVAVVPRTRLPATAKTRAAARGSL